MKIDGFKPLFLTLTALCLVAAATTANAYELRKPDGSPCEENGDPCNVYCRTLGTLAGTMYWNGDEWSDGQRWDKNRDVVARAIVAANGTSCD